MGRPQRRGNAYLRCSQKRKCFLIYFLYNVLKEKTLCFFIIIIFIFFVSVSLSNFFSYSEPVGCLINCNVSLAFYRINDSANPCYNFWDFACGYWLKHNPIPKSEKTWSVMDVIQQKIGGKLRKRLESVRDASQYFSFETKVRVFYSSCISSNREWATAQFLRNIVVIRRGWPFLKGYQEYSNGFNSSLGLLHRQYGIFPFFRVSVWPDDLRDENSIKIEPSGLGLVQKDRYNNPQIIDSYEILMKSVLRLLNISEPVAAIFVKNVMSFEMQLAEVTPSKVLLQDPRTFSRMTVFDLHSVATLFDWITFLQEYFPSSKISLTSQVVVMSQRYLSSISKLVATTSYRVLNNYFLWLLLKSYSEELSEKFQGHIRRFYQELKGVTGTKDQWEICLSKVEHYMGMGLSAIYIKEHTSQQLLTKAQNIAKDILNALIERVPLIDWMDERTKKRAKEKIENLKVMIGYPEFLLNNTALDLYYDELNISEDYLQNIIQGVTFRRKIAERRLQRSEKEWYMYPREVNAFNRHTGNEIGITAGMLQLPFLSSSRHDALNFGSIGSIIGHELIHTFDMGGSYYDKNGKAKSWWTSESWINFSQKMICLSKHYSQFSEGSNEIQGIVENLADLGGLVAAYQAYKKSFPNTSCPCNSKWNFDQSFFIAFAQSWCGQGGISRETPLYASNYMRVQRTLSLMPEFSTTFHCHKNSSIMPLQSCTIW